MTVRLIATDLDGTLLDSSSAVTPRTREALDAARARGIPVVPRHRTSADRARAIAGDAGFDGWALCSNGAYAVRLDDGRMLFADELPADTIRTLVEALRASVPGLLFASVREGGETFVAQDGYAEIAQLSDHKRDPRTMGGVPLEHVLAAPSLKLVIRHPELAPAALFDTLRNLGLTGFEATLSGAPFVEVMAEGVTKATGPRPSVRAPRHRPRRCRGIRRRAQRRRDAALGRARCRHGPCGTPGSGRGRRDDRVER